MFIAISVSGSAPAPGSPIGDENSVPNSLSVKNKYPDFLPSRRKAPRTLSDEAVTSKRQDKSRQETG